VLIEITSDLDNLKNTIMTREIILVAGKKSVNAHEMLENAGYKKTSNVTPDFPCREFFSKSGQLFQLAHPVWTQDLKSVRLMKF